MTAPNKKFEHIKIDELTLQSDDTTVGILLHASTDTFRCSTPAYFTEGIHNESTASVKDVEISSEGSLTIDLGASVDCDATDVSFGVTSTDMAFNLSGVPEYTSQAAAQAAQSPGDLFYMGTDGVLSITLSP